MFFTSNKIANKKVSLNSEMKKQDTLKQNSIGKQVFQVRAVFDVQVTNRLEIRFVWYSDRVVRLGGSRSKLVNQL